VDEPDDRSLSERVDGAIQAVLETEIGTPMLTGFVGIVNWIDDEGQPSYLFFDQPDQRLGTAMGLATQLDEFYRTSFRRFIFDGDDD
jgi:hypothetical protein